MYAQNKHLISDHLPILTFQTGTIKERYLCHNIRCCDTDWLGFSCITQYGTSTDNIHCGISFH